MASTVDRRVLFQRTWLLIPSTVFIAVGLLLYSHRAYVTSGRHSNAPYGSYSLVSPFSARENNMSEIVAEMWKPYLQKLDDSVFTSDDGKEHKIQEGSHMWQKKLGPRVVVLDVDTRFDLTRHERKMSGRRAGVLNHFLWALIHGYDYRIVRAPEYVGRHGTWVKVPIIKEALKTYDYAVFLDADAIIQYPRVPLEWMMSYWNYTEDTIMALAKDPDSQKNRDDRGLVMWNTGFIVAQNTERTQRMFTEWDDCPTGIRYPSCTTWATGWAHEQAALAYHLRYDYNTTENEIIPLSYLDANGPNGLFIKHDWFKKDGTISSLHQLLSGDFIRHLENYLLYEEGFFVDGKGFTYPLEGLII